MNDTVTKFRMGADIPEWCLGVEPVDATSRLGSARFGCDIDLIETDDYYLICPSNILSPVAGILDFAGAYNCIAIATSKPVRIVQGETVPFPRGMSPGGTNLPPYGLCIQPWAPMQLSVVEDPHPTFWSRLVYALRGR